jgi:hypothetical protein
MLKIVILQRASIFDGLLKPPIISQPSTWQIFTSFFVFIRSRLVVLLLTIISIDPSGDSKEDHGSALFACEKMRARTKYDPIEIKNSL